MHFIFCVHFRTSKAHSVPAESGLAIVFSFVDVVLELLYSTVPPGFLPRSESSGNSDTGSHLDLRTNLPLPVHY